MNYQRFLTTKHVSQHSFGKHVNPDDVHSLLFPFQRDVARWAVRKGRCAIFLDTGLGKTHILTEWARLLGERTLIIAPLSVARQTVHLAHKTDTEICYVRHQEEINGDHQIYITNYEMIDEFDPIKFGAVVLDESSIIKSLVGKTRRKLTDMFADTPYRLCCTATPAPNDHIELGNHAEFLGTCSAAEMLAMFFINANKEHTYFIDGKVYRRKGSNIGGQEWRLKHHAEQPFFQWLSTWAISLTKPSDLGYDDDGFVLPPLNVHPHFVKAEYTPEDQLFFTGLHGIGDRAKMRRRTIDARLSTLQDIVTSDEQWIIWAGLNDESKAIVNLFDDLVEVKGSDTPEYKARSFEDFQDNKFRILLTKAKIGGFGMNFQQAHNMVFFGLGDSWETWYQAIRREYRFGQTEPVNVHIIMSDLEAEVWANVMRKDAMAKRLRQGLIEQIRIYEQGELAMTEVQATKYEESIVTGQNWTAMLGDSCERLKELDDNSIDLSCYSPPFADLFVYTDSPRDLGNCRDWTEFFAHYKHIIQEVLRITKPGRLTCVHTSDIPAMAARDGWIGLKDFPGEVIRAYENEGWTFVGRAFVQKNPQSQAIRVKSKALLFVQLRKDSADSRPALVDQVLLFKKPGDNVVPIKPVENGEMDNETWIEWANGIWLGIQETDTLQYSVARDTGDEKHICPLQLGTIERCIKLYSNPGETILSPFMGIGSEIYQAIQFGRKGIGIELKKSYFDVAVKNLQEAEAIANTPTLFTYAGVEVEPIRQGHDTNLE